MRTKLRWLIAGLIAAAASVGAVALVTAGGAGTAFAATATIVQTGRRVCLGTPSSTVKLSGAVTAGDALVVLVAGQGYGGHSPTVTGVSDPTDGSWTYAENTGALQRGPRYLSYAVYETTAKASSSSGLTIKITQVAGQSAASAIALEVNGTLDGGALQGSIHTPSGASISAPVATVGDLDIGLFGIYENGQTISAGAGWTQNAVATNCTAVFAESAVPTSASAPTASDNQSLPYVGGWLSFTGGTGRPTTTSTTTSSSTTTVSTTTTQPTTSSTPTTTPSTTSTTTSTTPPPPPPTASGQSVTYFLAWDPISLADLPWNAITQIDMFSLASCTDTVTTSCPTPNSVNASLNSVSRNNLSQFVSTVHSHGRLAIITIGGSTNPDWGYACNPTDAPAFAQNLVNYAKSNGFDGVDLDIEQYPNTGQLTTAGLTDCASDVYGDAHAAGLLVTADVGAGYLDPTSAAMAPYIDQANLMSYGESLSTIATNLARLEKNANIPASKIVIGMESQGGGDGYPEPDCGAIAQYANSVAAGTAGVQMWELQADASEPPAGTYPCLSAIAPYVAPPRG
jgi:chitinase